MHKLLRNIVSALHWLNHNKIARGLIDDMADRNKKEKEAEKRKRKQAEPTRSGRRKDRLEEYVHAGPYPPAHAAGAQDPGNERSRREEREEQPDHSRRYHRESGREADVPEGEGRRHRHHRRRHEDEHHSHREPRASRRDSLVDGPMREEANEREKPRKDGEAGRRRKHRKLEKPKFSFRKGIAAYLAAKAEWEAQQRRREQRRRRGKGTPRGHHESERSRRRHRDDGDERGTQSRRHETGSRKHRSRRRSSPTAELDRTPRGKATSTPAPPPSAEPEPARFMYVPPAAPPVHPGSDATAVAEPERRPKTPPYPEGQTSSEESSPLPAGARHVRKRQVPRRAGTPPLPGEVRVPIEVVGEAGWDWPRDRREDRQSRGDSRNSADGSTAGMVGRRAAERRRRRPRVTEGDRRALYGGTRSWE